MCIGEIALAVFWVGTNAEWLIPSAITAVAALKGGYDAYQAGDTKGVVDAALLAPIAVYGGVSGYSANANPSLNYTEAEQADIQAILETSTKFNENMSQSEIQALLDELGYTTSGITTYTSKAGGTYPQSVCQSPTGVCEVRFKYPDPHFNPDPLSDTQVRINIKVNTSDQNYQTWLKANNWTYTHNGQAWFNVWNGNFVNKNYHQFLNIPQ